MSCVSTDLVDTYTISHFLDQREMEVKSRVSNRCVAHGNHLHSDPIKGALSPLHCEVHCGLVLLYRDAAIPINTGNTQCGTDMSE